MKGRRFVALLVAVMLLCLAGWVLVEHASRAKSSALALWTLPNSTNSAPGQLTFRIRNIGTHSVFLSEVIVEVQTPSGWQMITNSAPADPRNLDGGKTKDIAVGAPSVAGPWRVRIAYGDEVRYPELFLLKAGDAVSSRSFGAFKRWRPGDTWMGSNSLSSAVLSN
jgi:hypothetical protein